MFVFCVCEHGFANCEEIQGVLMSLCPIKYHPKWDADGIGRVKINHIQNILQWFLDYFHYEPTRKFEISCDASNHIVGGM